MRVNRQVLLAMIWVLTGAVRGAWGADEPTQTITLDRAALDKLVQEEVPQKQLPGLVQAEVKRQLVTLAQEGSRNARMNSAASTIQTLRSELELYKIQHADNFPTMAQLADWKALTSKTDIHGAISPVGEFGPYIQGVPTNPITGKKGVALAGRALAEAGWSWDEKQGKLYLVLTEADLKAYPELKGNIELDVVAAGAAAPSKSVVTMEMRINSLASLQQTVRGITELYKIQHEDKNPGFDAVSSWKFVMEKTEGNGRTVGPYMQAPPVNGLNGSSKVARPGAATADTGWTYDEATGKITAVVPAALVKEIHGAWTDYEVGK